MLKTSTCPKPVTRIYVFGAAGTLMPKHVDNWCHLTPLSRTPVMKLFRSWATEGLTTLKNSHEYTPPDLFIIHNITPLSGTHTSRILPLSETALTQRSFFSTSHETDFALGPRGTAVIELYSNQERNLIDFPTHSTFMVSSWHTIPLSSAWFRDTAAPPRLWCYLCQASRYSLCLSWRWGTWQATSAEHNEPHSKWLSRTLGEWTLVVFHILDK